MIGTLARREDIWMFRFKVEVCAAVLESEAAAFGNDGASKAGVV